MANLSSFTPGDLVISVYGDGATGDATNYTDNQASPIVLEELTSSGTAVGQLELPQAPSTINGVAQNAISGEYGSSSEGTLELSGDGQSLTIAGYGVNASTYNQGGAAVYGNAALAQSTSVPGGSSTAVARVIADIRYDGTVDTSTGAFNIDNTNNPRSVVTENGSSFYLAGQGVKGDKTQGLFELQDGTTTTTPTAINNLTDMRTAEIYNGNLYVSTDSKQGPTSNIAEYNGLPTGAATPTILPGINKTVTLSAGQGNSINGSTGTVNLSPENFYFANATTLYVADGGIPKAGGVGDGGLQKWTLGTNGQWGLDYTLSAGLNLQSNTISDPGSGGQGTTGLIGLTGVANTNGTVSLYATNSTVGDLNQTYLYGITDNLAATTPAAATGETFSQLAVAAPDTNIRGVAFAPQAGPCYCSGTGIRLDSNGVLVDVAVEHLAIGDLVVTASGARRPIKWIGHRTVDCRSLPRPHETMPIRITAHAFGADRPARDLFVSPGHAICVDVVDEVLIPAIALVNGATIQQIAVDTTTYWHIELDSHDVILAENLPAESYLDMGNRGFFREADVVDLAAGPDTDPSLRTHADFCRPFHAAGTLVEVVRAQLHKRAESNGWSLMTDLELHLEVDGRRLAPVVRGLTARFHVPADAKDIWLVSPTARPSDTMVSPDARDLGLYLGVLRIEDGLSAPRDLAIDDPLLCIGFHAVEDNCRRWTAGRARLPAALWEGCENGFYLRVELAGAPVPRWIADAESPRPAVDCSSGSLLIARSA